VTVRQIQLGIAAVFFVLGGWALFAPAHVIATVVTPQYQSEDYLAVLTMACFGAQAWLAGLFAATSRFTKWTFAAYGLALLPLFVFDYWFTRVVPVFNHISIFDLIGNVVMLILCVYGWRSASREATNSC
jgi:hypothetical protein